MVQERVYVRTGTTRQGVTVLSGCEGTTVDLEPMRAANHKIVCCARGDGNPESCVHPGRGVARVMAKANGMIGRRGVRSLRTPSVRTLRLVAPPACPSRLSANSSTQLAGGGKKALEKPYATMRSSQSMEVTRG